MVWALAFFSSLVGGRSPEIFGSEALLFFSFLELLSLQIAMYLLPYISISAATLPRSRVSSWVVANQRAA